MLLIGAPVLASRTLLYHAVPREDANEHREMTEGLDNAYVSTCISLRGNAKSWLGGGSFSGRRVGISSVSQVHTWATGYNGYN